MKKRAKLKVMKSFIAVVTFVLFCSGLNAQQVDRNYYLLSKSIKNPAVHLDQPGWTVGIAPIDLSASSTSGQARMKDLIGVNTDFIRTRILSESKQSTGSLNIGSGAPYVTFQPNKRILLGIKHRYRLLSNYWDVHGRLLSEIGEVYKSEHEYPYQLTSQDVRMNSAISSEVGAILNYKLLSTEGHTLISGINIKLNNGIAQTSIDIRNLSGTIAQSKDQIAYLTSASGQIRTSTSGKMFYDPKLSNMFKVHGLTLGADVGLIYTRHNSQIQGYKFLIAISITDIGRLRYSLNPRLSGCYDVSIGNKQGLYFNQNFSNSSFAKTAEVFDSYPAYFKKNKETNSETYMKLPTAMRGSIDYKISSKVAISGELDLPLTKKRHVENLYEPRQYTVAPRWTGRLLTVDVPIIFHEFAGLNSGVSIHYKGFMIGSNSLTALFRSSKLLDFRIGFVHAFDL